MQTITILSPLGKTYISAINADSMAAAGMPRQSWTGDFYVVRSVKVVGVAERVARSAAAVVIRAGAGSSWKSNGRFGDCGRTSLGFRLL